MRYDRARTGGERLDLAAGRLDAVQARLDDAGVVEDKQVARRQQAGQVAEDPVHRAVAAAIEQKRPPIDLPPSTRRSRGRPARRESSAAAASTASTT